MNKNIILLALAAVGLALFSLGWFSASAYDGYSKNSHIEEQYTLSNLQQVQNNKTRDKPSPYNWISKDNVLVYNDEVIIKIRNNSLGHRHRVGDWQIIISRRVFSAEKIEPN